jgi:hypothetical protein
MMPFEPGIRIRGCLGQGLYCISYKLLELETVSEDLALGSFRVEQTLSIRPNQCRLSTAAL